MLVTKEKLTIACIDLKRNLVPAYGQIVYNESTNIFECYGEQGWVPILAAGGQSEVPEEFRECDYCGGYTSVYKRCDSCGAPPCDMEKRLI